LLTAAETVWTGIERFFDERVSALQAAGIRRERLIIDPGLGFFLGRTAEPSVAALAQLDILKSRLGLPILVSPSRKSFLRTLTRRDLANIGPASLAAELYAAHKGVDFIRTHDVAAIRDGVTIWDALDGHSRL
jgi:dihydropteroate synthase type 2